MNIKEVHRPWQPKHRPRYNRDPYYQSQAWKNLRQDFRNGVTIVNGFPLRNIFCIDCYKETGRQVPGSNTDHIVRRKDGGTDTKDNLQTQCDMHHARKSAEEGNHARQGRTK